MVGKIDCPWTENGRSFTKTVYIKLTDIVPDLNYGLWTGITKKDITTYLHTDCSSRSGFFAEGDEAYFIQDKLILYPLAVGGYKLGWLE